MRVARLSGTAAGAYVSHMQNTLTSLAGAANTLPLARLSALKRMALRSSTFTSPASPDKSDGGSLAGGSSRGRLPTPKRGRVVDGFFVADTEEAPKLRRPRTVQGTRSTDRTSAATHNRDKTPPRKQKRLSTGMPAKRAPRSGRRSTGSAEQSPRRPLQAGGSRIPQLAGVGSQALQHLSSELKEHDWGFDFDWRNDEEVQQQFARERRDSTGAST